MDSLYEKYNLQSSKQSPHFQTISALAATKIYFTLLHNNQVQTEHEVKLHDECGGHKRVGKQKKLTPFD